MALRQSDSLTAEERISRAKIQLYRVYPFYSYLVENMTITKRDDIQTIGVDARGNCFYNEEWINKLTICAVLSKTERTIPNELLGVLAHEVLHLAFLHPSRGKSRQIMINGMSLWNIAIDMVVNAILTKEGMMLPKNGILPLPVSHSNPECDNYIMLGMDIKGVLSLSAEDIYEMMKNQLKQKMQEQKKNGKGKSQKQDKGKDKGEQGDPSDNSDGEGEEGDGNIYVSGLDEEDTEGFDSHEMFGKSEEELDKENGTDGEGKEGEVSKKAKDWSRLAKDAYNHAKMQGKEPAGMGREFDVYNKSYINWKFVIENTIKKRIPSDYSWSRLNRKFISQGYYLPGYEGEEITVLFSLDTSGSMSKMDLSKAITEMMAISRQFRVVEMRLLIWDCTMHEDILLKDNVTEQIKNIKISGNGGSSMLPVYNYIKTKKYDRKHNLMFVFTDGYVEYPKNKPCIDTYLVLTGNHIPKQEAPKWIVGVIDLD